MRIEPIELTILINEVDTNVTREGDYAVVSMSIGNTDTRKHTFFEVESFGEHLSDNMDLSIIFSSGVQFVCQDNYEDLKNKIKVNNK